MSDKCYIVRILSYESMTMLHRSVCRLIFDATHIHFVENFSKPRYVFASLNRPKRGVTLWVCDFFRFQSIYVKDIYTNKNAHFQFVCLFYVWTICYGDVRKTIHWLVSFFFRYLSLSNTLLAMYVCMGVYASNVIQNGLIRSLVCCFCSPSYNVCFVWMQSDEWICNMYISIHIRTVLHGSNNMAL